MHMITLPLGVGVNRISATRQRREVSWAEVYAVNLTAGTIGPIAMIDPPEDGRYRDYGFGFASFNPGATNRIAILIRAHWLFGNPDQVLDMPRIDISREHTRVAALLYTGLGDPWSNTNLVFYLDSDVADDKIIVSAG